MNFLLPNLNLEPTQTTFSYKSLQIFKAQHQKSQKHLTIQKHTGVLTSTMRTLIGIK